MITIQRAELDYGYTKKDAPKEVTLDELLKEYESQRNIGQLEKFEIRLSFLYELVEAIMTEYPKAFEKALNKALPYNNLNIKIGERSEL